MGLMKKGNLEQVSSSLSRLRVNGSYPGKELRINFQAQGSRVWEKIERFDKT